MQENNWIGLRKRDNFSYTKGEIPIYNSDCKNSIIISDCKKGFVEGLNNFALIKLRGTEYKIPISEINEILNISWKILKKGKIFYQKPDSILERENLEPLTEKEIRKSLLEHYALEPISILELENKKGKSRVYKISSENEGKFILKYRGDNLEVFHAQTEISNNLSYLPNIMFTKNGKSNIFLKNHIYALEEFIEGRSHPLEKKKYFELLGKNLAFMHNELLSKFNSNKNLEDKLFQEGIFFSESNMISLIIDLWASGDNEFFLDKIQKISKNIVGNLSNLPNQIIHGDLNRSNIIWNGNNTRFIDSENIMFSRRMREFIPLLLFKGNLEYPLYKPNSLGEFLEQYDYFSEKPLNETERGIIFPILESSLIKLYNIYNIRRNIKNERFKHQIIDSLKILGGEKNVHQNSF